MSNLALAHLLLDTHYWIWLQSGAKEHFTAGILKAVDTAATQGNLLLSVISIWELGMLEAKGRIGIHSPIDQWVREALAMPGLALAPLTPEIALDSCNLTEPFHGSLSGRIIIATAIRMSARLLTSDQKILQYCRDRHVAVL